MGSIDVKSPSIERSLSSFPAVTGRQTLLFDADDTLWENNIYFDRAIDGFIDLVAHPTLSTREVRAAFNALEHERVKQFGYGTDSFHRSMLAAFELLREAPCEDRHRREIAGLAHAILSAEIELLPGVEETLRALHGRHTLILMTKGDTVEQTSKLQRSGLGPLFAAVEVVREKHRDAYLELHARHACELPTTWMIGNSPKSDINPALAAGMHAVFVPHANTWVLEHEDVQQAPPGQHLVVLDAFARLQEFF